MNNRILIFIISILLFGFDTTTCYAQMSVSDIQMEMESLRHTARVFGKDSRLYNKQLLDLAFYCNSDTAYHIFYKDLALALVENNNVMCRIYGVKSSDYRQAMQILFGFYLKGHYVDDNYEDYHASVIHVLLSLENDIKEAHDNKEEFLSILSGVYEYEGNKTKAIRFARKRLTIAEKNILKDSKNYADAITRCVFLIGNGKKTDKLIIKVKNIINNLPNVDKASIWSTIAYGLKPTSSENIWLEVMENYFKSTHSIRSVLQVKLHELVLANKYDLINKILCLPQIEKRDRIKMYFFLGSFCGKNWQVSLNFRLKAMNEALDSGLEDLTFYEFNDKKTSQWQNIAVCYSALGDHKNEILAEENALNILEKLCSTESPEWINAALYLSALYSNWMSDNRKSISLLWKAVDNAKKIYGEDDEIIVRIMSLLIGHYGSVHEYDSQVSLSLELLNNPKVKMNDRACVYNQLSTAYEKMGRKKEAMAAIDNAITYAIDDRDRRTFIANKAILLDNLNSSNDAIYLLDSLSRNKPSYYNNDDQFYLLEQKAFVYGKYDLIKAYHLYEEAEKYIDESFLPNTVIRHYLNKAKVASSYYLRMKSLDYAIGAFKENNCQDSILLGDLYMAKADLCCETMAYDEALDLYVKIEPCYKYLQYDDEKKLTLLNNAANVLHTIGNYSRAISLQELVCDMRKVTLGQSHPLYLQSVSNLFFSYLDADSIDQASIILKEYEKVALLHAYADYKILFHNLLLAKKKGDYKSAKDYYQKAMACVKTSEMKEKLTYEMPSVYLALGDTLFFVKFKKEQLASIRKEIISDYYQQSSSERQHQVESIRSILDNAIKNAFMIPEMVTPALDFALFNKGLLFHTDAEIKKVLKTKGGNASLYQTYLKKKEQIEYAKTIGDSLTIKNIQEQTIKIERDLSQEFVSLKSLSKKLDITSKDVVRNIGSKSLAIDFVRYRDADTIKYGAFVFSSRMTSPVLIDLFTEKYLQQEAFLSDNKVNYNFFKDKTKENFRMVWGKLTSYMNNYTNIYFSADGLLNKLAIEYLCDENKTPVSERYNLHRVFHLADINSSSDIGNNYVILGVHNHDNPTMQDKELAIRGGEWINLDNVIPEVSSINTMLCSVIKGTVSVYAVDDSVRESFVKSLNEKPITLLHVATHAFYYNHDDLNNAVMKHQIDAPMAERALKADNTSLSGLVLRNGNKYRKMVDLPEKEDDILTSEEIENMSFPNLKLTVLSACQTGLGDVDGEGVWGLQRAFRIAGTQSLICALDYVDDFWTQRFMKEFYESLAQGQTIYKSFYDARNSIYKENMSNPKIWAKFILIE